jgi:hypothetical protein
MDYKMKTELTEFLIITYNKKSKHYINTPMCFVIAKTKEEACKKYKEMSNWTPENKDDMLWATYPSCR